MATQKQAASGIIDPSLLYTLERLAVTLGVTPRYVREEWINTGKLDAMPMGRTYVIPGEIVATFVLRNLDCKGEQ